MMAILEQWDGRTGSHTDNTEKYLLLMISKLGLDTLVFYCFCQKFYTFFLNMCSLSILLIDLLVVFFVATVWFLGPEKSPVSLCFILANASAIYGALPIPMMFLGLLDYCFEDASLCNRSSFCKFLKNAILILLVLILAIACKVDPVKAELMQQGNATRINVVFCRLDDSSVITYFVYGLFTAVICTMLPFCSMIPCWVKEAHRISSAREKQEKKRSDLLFTPTNYINTKSSEMNYLDETDWPRPPLWFSLTLGFALFWMPYLAVSVVCQLAGFAVPAYLTVNILWLECANSLLVGLVFWVKSKTQGPYSRLPENICTWHIFWHLSHGTQQKQNLMAVFDQSQQTKNNPFCV